MMNLLVIVVHIWQVFDTDTIKNQIKSYLIFTHFLI
jgi:hypothetical protein